MLKKTLFALTIVALFGIPAMAGQLKVEGNWPCAPIPVKACNIEVTLKMPYYVKLRVEPIKIKLVQIPAGTQGAGNNSPSLTFEGTAKDKDGNLPKAYSNFDGKFSCELALTADGIALQSNLGKWYQSISCNPAGPGGADTISKLTETVLTIICGVNEANLNAFAQGSEKKVAEMSILIVPI
jgi:hypothetical protein